jgi:hypothetical protein
MTFEDRLLTELRTEVAERASRAPARPPRRIGRRLLVGAAVAGIAAMAAVAIPIISGSQAPAYAVTTNADGSISVLIHELRDPDRLEADLAGLGVQVDISYHTSDLACPDGRFAPSQPSTPEQRQELASRWLVSDSEKTAGEVAFRIYPQRIPPGQTPAVRVDVDTANPDLMWVGFGPPPPCQGG